MAVDVRAVEALRGLYQPLQQITGGLSNTLLLSDSEAYSASLMSYKSTKTAMKSKIQKAETIYNDLSARFPGRSKKAEGDAEVKTV
jgi:hypothetical protein